jgi:hypothetical protein
MAFAFSDAYRRFEQEVKTQARYVYSEESNSFLAAAIATSKTRARLFPKGSIFARAQIGYDLRPEGAEGEIEIECGYPPERMRPRRIGVPEGRANPKGIPRLYMATTRDTAVAECRPWVGAYVSVAQFKMNRDCTIVDCSADERNLIATFEHDLPPEEREKVVWGEIAYAFSHPVQASETSADYAPTQILVEAFQKAGYEGIAYKSLLGEGHNIAMFDLDMADVINCGLYKINGVRYQIDQADNPYYIAKHYPEIAKQVGIEASAPEADLPYTLKIADYRPIGTDEDSTAE